MTRTFILSIAIFLIAQFVWGQNVEFKASAFKEDKDGLKTALEHIKTGDEHFKLGETALENKSPVNKTFQDALGSYLKAQKFNPNNADLNYKIGKCYMYSPTKLSALTYLERALALDPEVAAEMYYLLGVGYQISQKFEDAQKYFKLYKTHLKGSELSDHSKDIAKRLEECVSAAKMVPNPERVWLTNLKEVNSQYPDYCAAIMADESMMIFNSKRASTTGGKKDVDGNYFADIYVTYFENHNWTTPTGIGTPLNSEVHDECLALSPDGQQLFVYKSENNGDIYISMLDGDQWSSPEKLPEGRINTSFAETHASFSYDGIKRYFISDQYGNKDIFFSGVKDWKLNDWGKGQKIGYGLNSQYDEGSIYMHPDGKTLYFSSQGFNSMGGFDIFKSEWLDNGTWSAPVNMGYPINTPYDEMYFVMGASGKNAYLSSNREGEGQGDWDIYKVKFLGPPKPAMIDNEDHLLASLAEPIKEATLEKKVEVETKNLTVLRGVVLDSYTTKPVEAAIEIVDNVKNEVLYTIKSNKATGKFLVSLPAGINYGIAIDAENYLFHSENFDLPKLSDYQLVDKEILLKNVCVGCSIILNNVFFDVGKSDLRGESTMELNRLVALLKDIPQIKVEISGHTDNIGSENLNAKLSEVRAKAVVDYLSRNGVPAGRLVFKGYGSSKPVASNDSEVGRQLNRRTELKILESK